MATFTSSPVPAEAIAGARNLLVEAARVGVGDDLLLLVEPQGADYYDDGMGAFIAAQAEALGTRPRLLEVPTLLEVDEAPPWILNAIEQADRTIFLARIGDQLRFQPLPGAGRKVMSYALDFGVLGSPFATVPHALMVAVLERLTARIRRARHCTVTCAAGTRLTTPLEPSEASTPLDFTVSTFPVMIVPPIPAGEASGTLVLSQALTSTYIHPYPDSILPLPTPLTLALQLGEITGFDGAPHVVASARAQFSRVRALLGGPELRVGSWHAGINPMTFFPRPALSDIDRWSGLVFGSPRYAHVHMGGPSPGQICGQIFDPTIAFDDDLLWRDGRLSFLDTPDITDLLAAHGLTPSAFAARQDIGVAGLTIP